MRILFWLLVALDTGAIGLLFVLGLAAAGSSRTSPVSVVFTLLVLPGLPLLAAILLFLRASTPLLRAVALVLVAAPLAIVLSMQAYSDAQLRANTNAQGELRFFRDGPLRDVADAIANNDSAGVAARVARVDVNATGMDGTTLLISALRQLRKTPQQSGVLAALLKAGANPNLGTRFELPLQLALQVASEGGSPPVRLLLDAGANPNTRSSSGVPVFFGGVGQLATTETLELLLAHGADLTATDESGRTVLFVAADARNWKAVQFLLDRGMDPTQGRTLRGQTFREMLDANADWASKDEGFAEVVQRVGNARR